MPRARDTENSCTKLVCDFTAGATAHRMKFGGGRNQAIAKAVGLSHGRTPQIVDATAGLGRDAFLLASLGAEVTLIERSSAVHAALHAAIAKARKFPGPAAEIAHRMTLIKGDAKTILPTLNPEVILIDPMHPPRKNSALVKKEMRVLREIVGADPDALELMEVALATATKRVVLKWPQKADPLAGLKPPSHQITGKTTRYDVFMTQQSS